MELDEVLASESYLEHAFLRWVLRPAVRRDFAPLVVPQKSVEVADRFYRVDYAIEGQGMHIAVELDGFEFHGNRAAFSYDRLRQNDLHAAGWTTLRFSYDSIRCDTRRCVTQFQALLSRDPLLSVFLNANPDVEMPQMETDSVWSLAPSPHRLLNTPQSYFDGVRFRLNLKTLRLCQSAAFAALTSYFGNGGSRAACIMSVGAGKTALGVAACLGFTQRRAMIITPGRVIRGTFDKALDHQRVGNALYALPGGPLIPGCKPPRVLTLDCDEGPIRNVTREELLRAQVIVTNFHSLGDSQSENDLLSKLRPDDVDFIIVDEAHIAAADSYQRMFCHFTEARTLLMSACFQRLDGRPIEADVVYRYRLIDSIADGHAKNLRVHRFAPDVAQTTYEILWPDGRREEIVGRDALLELVKDERKLARVVAKSDASIRQVMRAVKTALEDQAALLRPVKPRVLFSALGERHADQIARIAEEFGIPCAYLHHSMSEARIKTTRQRFESDAGDLQGIVQLKMLGQGYDFPPICVVVPMRPYGSFSEFYQFIGRGIRVLPQATLADAAEPDQQFLDIIYHAELGLDEHITSIYRENDMEPAACDASSEDAQTTVLRVANGGDGMVAQLGPSGRASQIPEAFVLFEPGVIEQRVVHDEERVEQRRTEREHEALAQRYAVYAASASNPAPFEQFVEVMKQLRD